MYTPRLNQETSTTIMWQFIRRHPLCAVVTHSQQGLIASHIPMVLEENGAFGVLRGHVARANSQWNNLTTDEALLIFSGPEHYISAAWYPGKLDHGKEVPTWNYVAVHAYGKLRIVEDAQWLLDHLHALTDQSEVIAEVPWKVSDAPADFIQKLTGGIVGFELPISRLEGKWKVSQNRDDVDAKGVLEGLATAPTS